MFLDVHKRNCLHFISKRQFLKHGQFRGYADAKPTIIVRNFLLQQQMIVASIIVKIIGANIETKISKEKIKVNIAKRKREGTFTGPLRCIPGGK